MAHSLHEEIADVLGEDGPDLWIEDAPFGGKWKQPKTGPWVSVSILGKHEDGKDFGGTFPLRHQQRIKLIRKKHGPWLKWAKKRWGDEPHTITAFWHPKQGSKGQVLWSWDRWDGFRDTAMLRTMQRQKMNEGARSHPTGKAAKETGLGAGSVFQDTTGSRFKVISRYRWSGAPRLDGYKSEALGGSHLTMAGTIYKVPYTRVETIIKRVGSKPAPMRD